MSQQTRQFDESVADAADCYVEHEGSVAAAIEALADRRPDAEAEGRVEEAIAYLRYTEGADDG